MTSAANPVVKRMRMLASRKFRQREGISLAEGIQPVWQAVEAGAPVEALIFAPDLLRYQPAVEMVLEQERRGVRVVRLSAELFQRLSERDGAAGLAAIVGQRLTSLRELPAGATADPDDPAAIKASMGAIFSMPVARAAGSDEFFAWADERDLAVVTTSARAERSVWEARYPDPLVVLMGSEGPGLADADLRRGRLQVSIPMTGTAESLNLAVATGVVLFEVVRQRRERARD